MKYNNVIEYSNAIADMFDWNYTTFIRTYRYITSSVAAKWGQKIANRRNVKAVYVSIERDAEKTLLLWRVLRYLEMNLYRSRINFWERKHEHVFQIRQQPEHHHLF